MKQQKKNKFFTFIFSFLPGAAEMYMGFMKNGVSLMALFVVSIGCGGMINGLEFLISFTILIWFYGFFHAINLAAVPAETFDALEDKFVWEGFMEERNYRVSNPTIRKWAAGILVVIGAVLLWENFSSMVYNLIPDEYWHVLYPVIDSIPQVVIALVIIIIGIKLMAGKKEEINGDER